MVHQKQQTWDLHLRFTSNNAAGELEERLREWLEAGGLTNPDLRWRANLQARGSNSDDSNRQRTFNGGK